MKLKSFAIALATGAALAATAFGQAKLTIKGSDTLGAKLVPQLKADYVKSHPNVDIEILAQGSGHAFTNLLAGTANIGMASRSVKQSEADQFTAKGETLVEHVAGWDMIAVIVNEANPVKKLSLEQIGDIFTGKITDWSEVGGTPGKISLYTRNTSSGTYASFAELAMGNKDYAANSQKMEGNQPICTEVAKNVNGIGYVGLAYAKGANYKTVKVNGVAAKASKVADYPIARKLFYYTVGEPTGEVADFIKYATTSDAADAIVEKVGFIPASAAK